MSKRVFITLAIIAGIGLGTGALVFGVLMLIFSSGMDEEVTFVAAGSALLTSSAAALVAHLSGGFRDLDDHDL
jgi:hypothetical protein